jgi:hypothetical protein
MVADALGAGPRNGRGGLKEGSAKLAGSSILNESGSERKQVPKPNYQFEKRKRELEKKKKKEEKTLKKATAVEEPSAAEPDAAPEKEVDG